jgi:hypothetical protein
MDVRQAGPAPAAVLTDDEVAAVGARLRALRHERDTGGLSGEDYAALVRSVLERRQQSLPWHHPERRRPATGAGAG